MRRNIDAYALEKGKISARQLSFLIITTIIATADVFLPSYVAQEAGPDSWISVILGTASSMVIIMLFLTLGLRFPDKTIIQYSCDILGKPLGKLVGVLYLLFMLDVSSSVSRELGEIFVTAFNPDSPLVIYPVLTLLVASYALVQGLEVIARVNEFILPIGLGILGLTALMNVNHMDFSQYLPVMANGLLPPLRGGLLIQTWMLEIVLFLQVIPYVKDKNKIRKYTAFSVLTLGVSMGLGVLIIAVFGTLAGELLFPALEFVRFASIGEYIQNMDITIMGVWIIGMFIKIVISYYVLVLGLSQLCNLKTYKSMILPVGLVIAAISLASSERVVDPYNFGHRILPFYTLIMALIIPGILLLTAAIRGIPAKAREKSKSGSLPGSGKDQL